MNRVYNSKIIFIIVVVLLLLLLFWILFFLSTSKKNPPKTILPPPTPVPVEIPETTPLPPLQGRGTEPEWWQKLSDDYVKNTPILQKLPINSPFFDVEYISEDHLIIHSKTNDKNRALLEAQAWLDDLQENYQLDTSKVKLEYK